jgi:hypothetical protein
MSSLARAGWLATLARVRLILLEFNELSPPIVKKLMAEGELPNFKRFHDESSVYETEADELAPNLEPWIQWITVHSGIPYREHGIERLGDGHHLNEPNLWDLVSDRGGSVWVCGSMNINYSEPINGWVLPDPWVTKVRPYPEDELRPYYRFVSANVQEHTREQPTLSRSEQLEFVTFMARHGLSPATAATIVRQIASERRSNTRWRRPVILDRLQFDLFRWRWKRAKPDFSTFFLNSTAHYQHIYWRHMDPESFEIKPDPAELAIYEDAIPYGYRQMDRMCARFLDLAGDDTTLVLLTALSQEPCLKYEDLGGKMMYRPRDFGRLLEAAGIDEPAESAPVMAEEFQLDFATEEAARDAEGKLAAIRYRGEPAMRVERRGNNIFGACGIIEQVEPDAVLQLDGGERTVPFLELFYQLDLVKSGIHHPDGMMWIRTPARSHSVNPEKIPLVSVAPTMLGVLGIEPPSQMKGEPLAAAAAAA